MKTALAFCLCVLTSTVHAQTPDAPIAQISTVPARQAVLANIVTAYGTLTFTPGQQMALNLPYAAQITHLWVTSGQSIQRGTPLYDVAPDPAALLAYQQAQSAVTLARRELQRNKSLFTQRLATQSQVDTARKALDDALHSVSALQIVTQRHVTAPFEGEVIKVLVAQGDRAQAGSTIMLLGRTGADTPAHAVVGVEPADSLSLRPGMPVELTVLDTRPGQAATPFKGTVSAIRSALNPQSKLVEVTVGIPPATPGLITGTAVKARIATEQGRHWIVPRSAVLRDSQGAYLFQVVNGKAKRINVVTRVSDKGQLGIDGALTPAQPIVVTGNYELKNGMAVREATP
ncbi:MAG: hypothetical protein B7X10_01715 [Burkholderiales bacterium 21-58-4]|nr:MAG: hypothetical protein B7X10_01715 [Burkholderiales bacterium 21-58-4]